MVQIIIHADDAIPPDVLVGGERIGLRDYRNGLLVETDVWGLSDYPATAEQTAYRQALRDITGQAGFPNTITWPTKPE